jgi:hypothetical protein
MIYSIKQIGNKCKGNVELEKQNLSWWIKRFVLYLSEVTELGFNKVIILFRFWRNFFIWSALQDLTYAT